MLKKCCRCNIQKDLNDFYCDKRNNDGRRYECKTCSHERDKIYLSNPIVQRRIKECDKKRYQKNRKEILSKSKKEYQENIEEYREQSRKYRRKHLEECRLRSRKHYQKNKDNYLKRNSLRNRRLGFFRFLENPFPSELKVVWHHVNDMIVIPVPEEIHKLNLGPKHREKMNTKIKSLYGLDIKKLGLSRTS